MKNTNEIKNEILEMIKNGDVKEGYIVQVRKDGFFICKQAGLATMFDIQTVLNIPMNFEVKNNKHLANHLELAIEQAKERKNN